MKTVKRGIVAVAMAGALVLTSVAGTDAASQAAPKAKKIVMNKKKVTLEAGKTFKLKVKKVKPAKASKKVTYKSSSKKVATVSKKGVIKAKKAGTAKITVTSKKNKKAKATVKVTVVDKKGQNPGGAQGNSGAAGTAGGTQGNGGAQTSTPTASPTPTPKPVPTPLSGMVAYKIADDAAVTIDGVEDEVYKDVPELPFASRIICDNEGSSTTQGSVKLLWNKSAIYGIIDVKDDNVVKDGANDYQVDGIELFLDENNDPKEVDESWESNPDSLHYRFTGITKGGSGKAENAYIPAGGCSEEHEKRVTAYYVTTDTGYKVEFKIDFMTEKTADSVVAFDIIIQDCDDDGRNAEIYLRKDAEETLSYWNNGAKYADLVLYQP